jgi:hypothetical protein
MAAKLRPPHHPPDIQEIFALHLREECRKLKAAGKIAAARKALKQAQSIQAGLSALEAEVRVAGEHRRDKRFAKD